MNTTRKKVGVMTLYYKNYNFGGQLQGYALQKVIDNLGFECNLISFKEKKLPHAFKRINSLGLKCIIERYLQKRKFNKLIDTSYIDFKEKFRNFDEFINQIPHTEVCDDASIKKHLINYDYFICGSDQIWNPGWWNDAFFLDFTNKRKIAYSASIGRNTLTNKEKKYIKNKTEDFYKISVREIQAQQMIQPFIENSVEVTLDPTLLLEADEYESIMREPKELDGFTSKYALIYIINNNEKMLNVIIERCKKEKLKPVIIPFVRNRYNDVDYHTDAINALSVGPKEWLWLVKNASLVFTDSFHGTVFSIIFNRQFLTIETDKNLGKNAESSRLYSLTSLLSLKDRVLSSEDIEFDINDTIDYSNVYDKLRKLKVNSMNFLEAALYEENSN